MTQPIIKTVFTCRKEPWLYTLFGFIYTPNESLGVTLIDGRRATLMFWEDEVTTGGVTRTITFEWWQEETPAPAAETKQPDLFGGK